MVIVSGKLKPRRIQIFAIAAIFLLSMPMLMIIQPFNEISKVPFSHAEPLSWNTNNANDEPSDTFTLAASNDSDWIEIDPIADSGTPAISEVSDLDTTGMTVTSYFYGFWRGNVTLNGVIYDTINMPGASSVVSPGQPALPRMVNVIEIPYGVNVSVSINRMEYMFTDGYLVAPVQAPSISLSNYSRPDFVIDDLTYTTNLYYPYYNYSLNGELAANPIDMRGHRLLELVSTPVQYNPQTGYLRIFTEIEFDIIYSQPAIFDHDPYLYSEEFEDISQGLILNYHQKQTPIYNATPGFTAAADLEQEVLIYDFDGARYLIIACDEFADAAQRLADWKTRKGMFARVKLTSEIPGASFTSELNEENPNDKQLLLDRILALKEYMKSLLRWKPVPTYVLLMGDVSRIPCDYSITHRAEFWDHNDELSYTIHGPYWDSSESRIATDVTYFCVRGNDFLPEFIHGRLSVDSVEEAETVVEKIISYERQPSSVNLFYSNILMSSFYHDEFQGYSHDFPADGMEDEPFIITSENLTVQLQDIPYFVNRAYTASAEVLDTHLLYDGITTCQGVNAHTDWGADTSDITHGINLGNFLVYHIGHGNSENFVWWNYPFYGTYRGAHDGWGPPLFKTGDLVDLENDDRMPFILSMSCHTGWFDGETDGFLEENPMGAESLKDHRSECFSEQLLRLATGEKNGRQVGGAIAVIGSSRASYNKITAELTLGITNSFWPGILDLKDVLNRPINPRYNLGVALMRGKTYIFHKYGNAEDRYRKGNTTLLTYHLFGDPETSLWTSNPIGLSVNHPWIICYDGSENVVVKVRNSQTGEPIVNATVCLNRDSDIYSVGYTDYRGWASFLIEPQSRGAMQITVTGHNLIPYLSQIYLLDYCPAWLLLIIGLFSAVVLAILDRLGIISLSNFVERVRDWIRERFPS